MKLKQSLNQRKSSTRVMILGVTGMLGHKLYQLLSPKFKVIGTIRGRYNDIKHYDIFDESNTMSGVDVLKTSSLRRAIEEGSPDVVINCIGIIKQVKQSRDRLLSIQVNSLFPHQLYKICAEKRIRLIHISTDCVFSGKKGNYREDDPSDADDIYGKTKYLGEVAGVGALTIRSSLIGRELAAFNGLVEWFIANKGGRVNGFTNVIFSGFTTCYFAKIIEDIIANHPGLSGIYNISSEPISKFGLLTLLNQRMELGVEIVEYPDIHSDRSLDSTVYRQKTDFQPPAWAEMVSELARDARQYEQWRA